MLVVVEVLGSISSVLLLFLYILSFFHLDSSTQKWKITLAVIFLMVILSTLNLFPSFVIPRVICLTVGGAILSYLFFNTTIWQAIFMGVSFEVIAAILEVVMMGILGLLRFDTALLMTRDNTRMVFIIASQLLLLSIIVLARIFSKKQEGGLSFEWLLPLFPCQILSVFVCYIVLCKTVQNSFDPFLILVLLTLLCINITIVFYSEAMRSSESRRRNSELAEQQYTMQKEYYQRLHENQEETRALWHDIKKYVLAMQAFADKKDQQQLQQIVQQANDTLDSISTVVDIDNIVISSILDSYARSAEESDIDFHLDVMVPPTLPISPVDLYIILGNTLDNAIEACIALPKGKRYINILLRKENGILFYRIQNSYNGEKEKIHLHGKFHGYGLSNVRKCVSKYGGSVTPVQGTDSYMIEMYLNCK